MPACRTAAPPPPRGDVSRWTRRAGSRPAPLLPPSSLQGRLQLAAMTQIGAHAAVALGQYLCVWEQACAGAGPARLRQPSCHTARHGLLRGARVTILLLLLLLRLLRLLPRRRRAAVWGCAVSCLLPPEGEQAAQAGVLADHPGLLGHHLCAIRRERGMWAIHVAHMCSAPAALLACLLTAGRRCMPVQPIHSSACRRQQPACPCHHLGEVHVHPQHVPDAGSAAGVLLRGCPALLRLGQAALAVAWLGCRLLGCPDKPGGVVACSQVHHLALVLMQFQERGHQLRERGAARPVPCSPEQPGVSRGAQQAAEQQQYHQPLTPIDERGPSLCPAHEQLYEGVVEVALAHARPAVARNVGPCALLTCLAKPAPHSLEVWASSLVDCTAASPAAGAARLAGGSMFSRVRSPVDAPEGPVTGRSCGVR